MKNNFSEKSDALLKQKTTDEMLFYRSDFADKWLHKGGLLFKFAVILAWIVGIYNAVMFSAQTLGFWFVAADNSALVSDARNATIILALVVIYLVLLFFKKHLPSSVVSLVFGVFYLANTSLWTDEVVHESNKLTTAYLYIPATILAMLPAIYMLVTIVADKIEFSHTYNKIVEKIIATYHNKEGEVTTEEEWDRRIEEYVTPAKHQKPKKSLRKKLDKNNEQSE